MSFEKPESLGHARVRESTVHGRAKYRRVRYSYYPQKKKGREKNFHSSDNGGCPSGFFPPHFSFFLFPSFWWVGKSPAPGCNVLVSWVQEQPASDLCVRVFLGLRFGLSWGFCGRVTKFACENGTTNEFHENCGDGRKDEINKGEYRYW